MIEKALAAASLACLVGFMAIIVWFVPDVDLIVVTVAVLAMAAYDFYRETFGKGGGRPR